MPSWPEKGGRFLCLKRFLEGQCDLFLIGFLVLGTGKDAKGSQFPRDTVDNFGFDDKF